MANLISNWDLVDIIPKKGKFTWSNQSVGPRHIEVILRHFPIHSNLMVEDILIFSHIIM
jgi:hypothetical protein